jgi:DNA-binding transcriptional ArsR family regulator
MCQRARQLGTFGLGVRQFIDYRRSSMEETMGRQTAEKYAEWFRALSDPTRVQLLAWLARQPGPVPVRDIVAAFPLSQSTVSHHLAALARTCFVTVERHGTSSLYAANPACMTALPQAADDVMNGLSMLTSTSPVKAR